MGRVAATSGSAPDAPDHEHAFDASPVSLRKDESTSSGRGSVTQGGSKRSKKLAELLALQYPSRCHALPAGDRPACPGGMAVSPPRHHPFMPPLSQPPDTTHTRRRALLLCTTAVLHACSQRHRLSPTPHTPAHMHGMCNTIACMLRRRVRCVGVCVHAGGACLRVHTDV